MIQFTKLVFYLFALWAYLNISIKEVHSQEVTYEMLSNLHYEVDTMLTTLRNRQDQMDSLITRINNLEQQTDVVVGIEVAEIRTLITASNKQEESLTMLFYHDGLWRHNFRSINNTFTNLRKVVGFTTPSLYVAPAALSRESRMLSDQERTASIRAALPTSRHYRIPTTTSKYSRRI